MASRKQERERLRAAWLADGLGVDDIAGRFRAQDGTGALVAYRWACNMTQDQVADGYNQLLDDDERPIDFRTISDWERWPLNGRELPLSALKRLAVVFGTTVTSLAAAVLGDDMPQVRDARQPHSDGSERGELMWLRTGHGSTGAVLRTFEATHPDELRRILGLANVSAAKIERLEHAADHYALIYAAKTPSMIGEEVTDHYHAVERLLDRSQQHRRRLLAVAGRFAGLMSWLAFDTHRPALAHDYLDVGIEAAEQAKDTRLAVYLAASRNRIATLTDDHASILAAGQEANARAEGRLQGRLAAWIFAIEGRGLAGLGRLREAEAAFAASETALAKAKGEEPDMAFFNPVRLRALVGESYVLLGRPRQATRHLGEALREVEPARAKTHAIILLDSARAAIQRRDHDEARALLDQACSIDRPALVATHAQRVGIIERALAATGAE